MHKPKETFVFNVFTAFICSVCGAFVFYFDMSSNTHEKFNHLLSSGTIYLILLVLSFLTRSRAVLIFLGILFIVFFIVPEIFLHEWSKIHSKHFVLPKELAGSDVMKAIETHNQEAHYMRLLSRLTGLLAIVSVMLLGNMFIHKSRLAEKYFRELSIRDPLTGVYTRRYFFEALKQHFNRVVRNDKYNFSIIIMDIDHFRKINDQFLHQGGDFVLQSFCQRVEKVIRNADIFGRYGGEEFLLILPDTDIEHAVKLAERIRISTEKMEIVYKGQPIPMTVSLGVGDYNTFKYAEVTEMIRNVDRALYQAKEGGRNQVQKTVKLSSS